MASPPVWVDGRHLRAASVAVKDLTSRIAHHLAGFQEPDPFSVCLTKPESYDVQIITEDDLRYVIYVKPIGERCAEGGAALKGGDAKYEVLKSDFALLSAEYGE